MFGKLVTRARQITLLEFTFLFLPFFKEMRKDFTPAVHIATLHRYVPL